MGHDRLRGDESSASVGSHHLAARCQPSAAAHARLTNRPHDPSHTACLSARRSSGRYLPPPRSTGGWQAAIRDGRARALEAALCNWRHRAGYGPSRRLAGEWVHRTDGSKTRRNSAMISAMIPDSSAGKPIRSDILDAGFEGGAQRVALRLFWRLFIDDREYCAPAGSCVVSLMTDSSFYREKAEQAFRLARDSTDRVLIKSLTDRHRLHPERMTEGRLTRRLSGLQLAASFIFSVGIVRSARGWCPQNWQGQCRSSLSPRPGDASRALNQICLARAIAPGVP
jgi:hypothetical protein